MLEEREIVDLTKDVIERKATKDTDAKVVAFKFLNGVVKLTGPSDMNDSQRVSFEEIVQVGGLQKCLLSSYVVDEEWLLPRFDNITNVILVTHDGERGMKTRISKDGNLTMVWPAFPKFPSYGVMHSKIMLLWYDQHLRIVISTGNLVPYDYDKVQNMVFIQDLLRVKVSTTEDSKMKDPVIEDPKMKGLMMGDKFKTDLMGMLQSMGVGSDLVSDEELLQFDFERVKAKLVFSIPGMANCDRASGLGMLARQVPRTDVGLECQGSSLGVMGSTWLKDFACCAGGVLPVKEDKKRLLDEESMKNGGRLMREGFMIKIVFPTMKHVVNSPYGPGAFGTIFCQERYWSNTSYPHDAFYQCESICKGSRPLHTKTIIAIKDEKPMWYYIGSANFTPSAWGKFVKEKRALMVANYELGVVVMAEDLPDGFPSAYKRPPSPYDKDDLPWMQDLLL
jgi:tyrosyl-DNA phosphodiesterase-1